MPEMTCRPWVTRYSQTGRVGQKNHGCGMLDEVTDQPGDETHRDRDAQCEADAGGDGRAAQRGGLSCRRQAGHHPAADRVDSRDRKADVVGQPRRAVDADRRPPEPRADRARRLQPDPSRVDSVRSPSRIRPRTARRGAAIRRHGAGSATGHRPGRRCRRPAAPSATGRCPAADRTRRGAAPGRRCGAPVRLRWRTGRPPVQARRAAPDGPPNVQGRNPGRSSGRRTGRPPRGRTARRHCGRRASCAPAAGQRGRRRGGPSSARRRARGRRGCRACRHTAAVARTNRLPGAQARRTSSTSSTVSTSASVGNQAHIYYPCRAAPPALQRRCRVATSGRRAGSRPSRRR